jgi:hypothetical protein
MEHTHKMYLVPQHQLDALKHNQPRESVRQTAENDLDKDIATVLNTPDTDLYAKAARYGAVLQRYLSMIKQGQREHGELTLSLADGGSVHTPVPAQRGADDDEGLDDHIYNDILKHIPVRSKSNTRHILDSLKKTKNVSWSDKGELVLQGKPIKGSHMFDLLKNVTAPYHIGESVRPQGWNVFLQSLASNNIPLSSIPNKQLRHTVDMYKYMPPSKGYNAPASMPVSSVKRRRRHQPMPSIASPGMPMNEWLTF